jgi:hypothetical protein
VCVSTTHISQCVLLAAGPPCSVITISVLQCIRPWSPALLLHPPGRCCLP